MLINIFETLIGLTLFNISWKSLDQTFKRKFKEGFVISLITSVFVMIHGILSLVFTFPDIINMIFYFLSFSLLTLSLVRISSVKLSEVR